MESEEQKSFKIKLKDILCKKEKNLIEVQYWKKIFQNNRPIPQPIINNSNEIIAFENCFYAMQEIGVKESFCVKIANENK